MQPSKILVLSHDANLNGAPITLLRLMKLLHEQGWRFNTLLRKGGPLEEDFRRLSDVFGVYEQFDTSSFTRRLFKFLLHRKNKPLFYPAQFANGAALILNNTITNGEILDKFKIVFDGPVFSYIHEMEMSTRFYTNRQALQHTLDRTLLFLVSSNAVRDYLFEKHKIPWNSVARLNYYLPLMQKADTGLVQRFKQEYGLQESFVVASIGINDWRKGCDLFMSVMVSVCRKRPDADIRFVWLGGFPNSSETIKMMHDAKWAGVEEKLLVISPSKAYAVIYPLISVFVLPSREDPFPLVLLEAALHSVPLICFQKAGGAPEFVGNDAGTAVPYLDVIAMADAIIKYYDDPAYRAAHGVHAQQRVKKQYSNGQLILEQFSRLLSLHTQKDGN